MLLQWSECFERFGTFKAIKSTVSSQMFRINTLKTGFKETIIFNTIIFSVVLVNIFVFQKEKLATIGLLTLFTFQNPFSISWTFNLWHGFQLLHPGLASCLDAWHFTVKYFMKSHLQLKGKNSNKLKCQKIINKFVKYSK